MKVAIVFEPDLDLGVDPLDEAKMPRSLGVFLDSAKTDVLLAYREYDVRIEDGVRTHVFMSGVWENIEPERIEEALEHLTGFGKSE